MSAENPMTATTDQDPRLNRPNFISILLGLCAFLFAILAIICGIILLYRARQGSAPTGFDAFAIAALIALIGTSLSALTAVYSATIQASTTARVGEYNADTNRKIAELKKNSDEYLAAHKESLDRSLAVFKKNADEALTKLKISLDASQVAHRELFGCATVYFHCLRAGAMGVWSKSSFSEAQAAMVIASRQLLYVENDMRDQWFEFWQHGENIFRRFEREDDPENIQSIASKAFLKKVLVPESYKRNDDPPKIEIDFREMHNRLEQTARKGAGVKNSNLVSAAEEPLPS